MPSDPPFTSPLAIRAFPLAVSRGSFSAMSRPLLLRTLACWIAVAALWAWLFFHLQVEWTLNPQYNYGWGVPFLALLLFYFRWQRRPPPDISGRNDVMVRVSMAVTLVLLLPIRVVEEANPDWRF